MFSPFLVSWTVPLSAWVSSTDGMHNGSKGNFLEKWSLFSSSPILRLVLRQGLLPRGKADGMWSWQLSSIYSRRQELAKLYLCFPTPAYTGDDNALEEALASRNSNGICQQLMEQAGRQFQWRTPFFIRSVNYVCMLLTYRLAFHPFCRWLNTIEIRECFDC